MGPSLTMNIYSSFEEVGIGWDYTCGENTLVSCSAVIRQARKITSGCIAPACAARVTWLGLCGVCVSVKSHLTSGASVRPETSVTYSAGNGGQKICRFFSETASFKSYLRHPTAILQR